MAEELKSIDISDSPDVLRLAQEVAESGVGRVLRTADGELAVLKPVPKPKPRKRSQRARPVTKEDSLFRLIGIGRSDVGGDGSERKHELLAQAYRPRE